MYPEHQGIQILRDRRSFHRTLYAPGQRGTGFRHSRLERIDGCRVVDIAAAPLPLRISMSWLHGINDVVFAQDTGTFDFVAQRRSS